MAAFSALLNTLSLSTRGCLPDQLQRSSTDLLSAVIPECIAVVPPAFVELDSVAELTCDSRDTPHSVHICCRSRLDSSVAAVDAFPPVHPPQPASRANRLWDWPGAALERGHGHHQSASGCFTAIASMRTTGDSGEIPWGRLDVA
jgi:hypothetical protein